MATKEAQREYQRLWMQRRRATWFQGKVCVDCGTGADLQLDHVDPSTKIHHNVWSWAQERRNAELAKCVARCKPCHDEKSRGEHAKGEQHGLAKLKTPQILEIRKLFAEGWRQVDLARHYGVSRDYIWRVVRGIDRRFE